MPRPLLPVACNTDIRIQQPGTPEHRASTQAAEAAARQVSVRSDDS